MNEHSPTNKTASTSEQLKEIDARRKRAINKAIGFAFLTWVLAFAISLALKSARSRSSMMEIFTLFWETAVVFGSPLLVGILVYRKNR